MKFIIKNIKERCDGTAHIDVFGNSRKLEELGIGLISKPHKYSLVNLKNDAKGKQIGGIVKSLSEKDENYIVIDKCLLNDLSASIGSEVLIEPLMTDRASEVHIAVSSVDLKFSELKSLCKTYLLNQPLSRGQQKPIYLFTGEKVNIEILNVEPSNLCVFSETTEIIHNKGKAVLSGSGLDEVGGLISEKKVLRERILLPIVQPEFFSAHGIRPPRGILLCGPPGCGKTMIARALASEIDANFLELSGSEIFSPHYGESEKVISETFKRAEEKTPAIILIDEVDSIGGSRSTARGELERRLVTTLLTAMDGMRSIDNVIVVGTTNTPNDLDPALRRPGRFDYEINIGVPDKIGRLDILEKKTEHMAIEDNIDLVEIARKTHGFVGADLMLLCREAAFEALTRDHSLSELINREVEHTEGLQITKNDFDVALKKVKPSGLREFTLEVPTHLSWKSVGGLSSIKETIIQEIVKVLTNPDSFMQVGITPIKGVLLYGPPGTGKTLLARVIANEAEANFISVKGPEVLSKWVGESEERIRNLFFKAKESSPCIIFFDEIDAITGTRGKSVTDSADRVVNQLLTEMDGFDSGKNVCVVAATNRIDGIDPALLRPGRFDYQIMVPLPDEKGLLEIFKIHSSKKPIDDDIDWNKLVLKAKQFSGAHIEEVCRRAALAAFRENNFVVSGTIIKMKHFLDAIDIVRNTVKETEKPGIGFTTNL